MAKRKKQPRPETATAQEQLEALSVLAATLPDGWLDDELEDCCNSEARLAFESIAGEVTLAQLEYLYHRGYTLDRLHQLIDEAHQEGGDS